MSKDIPEIDDLTRGINDSELILTEDTAETQVCLLYTSPSPRDS